MALDIHLDPDGNPSMPGARRTLAPGVWPPPPSPDDLIEYVPVGPRPPYTRVPGRVVKLWGQRVVIDETGAAWCDGCNAFVSLGELVAADNGHRVGLRPIPGAVLPLSGDDPPGPSPAFW